MKKIRVGIIGQGRSGRGIHRHLFTTVPELQERFEVVAIADRIRERWEPADAVPDNGVRKTENYKDLLNDPDIDLIVNATMSKDHVDVSIEALEAGKDVICEKPLCRTVADVERIEEAIARTGRFFAVFQQSRFRPLFRKSLEIMQSGILGRIVMIKVAYNTFGRRWDWQTIQDMCAGELLNTGPHPMDQVVQFYGGDYPQNIVCVMERTNTSGDAEDHIKILMHGKDQPTVDVEISRCCMFPGTTYEIYGPNGGLKASGNTVTWKYFLPEDEPERPLVKGPLEGAGRMPVYCGEKIRYYENTWNSPPEVGGMDYWGRCYYLQVYDALTAGKPMDVTLDQVKRQIRMIEECHRQNPLPKFVEL